MKKNNIANSICALSFFMEGVAWLISVCAGEQLPPLAEKVISILTTVLLISWIVFFYIGFSDVLLNLPVWLTLIMFVLLLATSVYGLIVILQWIFKFEITGAFSVVFVVLQGCSYLVMYILMTCAACKTTESLLFRILFIAIGLFLVLCVVASWFPALAAKIPVPLFKLPTK